MAGGRGKGEEEEGEKVRVKGGQQNRSHRDSAIHPLITLKGLRMEPDQLFLPLSSVSSPCPLHV